MRELWAVARQSECLTEHIDRFLRSAQENVRRPQSATGAEKPAGALALLRGVDELGVTQHPVDPVGSDGGSDVRECRTKRCRPVGGCRIERLPLGGSDEPPRSDRIAEQHGHPGVPRSTAGRPIRSPRRCSGRARAAGLDPPATGELVPVPERDPAGLREIAALVRVGERLVRASVQLAPICCPLRYTGTNSGWRRLSSARRRSPNRWW